MALRNRKTPYNRIRAAIKTSASTFKDRIGSNRYLFIVAGIIGLLDGIAAVLLKSAVHGAESLARAAVGHAGLAILLSALPMVGIGLTILWIRFFVRENIGHGVCGVLEVIATPGARLKPHNVFSSMVGCTLTAGFGGSVGMEGPIAATGAAIGDNLASLSDAAYKRRMILIGCGAAGAISAIFKAPIAGILFAVEVLALDAASLSVIALLISSSVACLFSMVVSGYQVEFQFSVHGPFNPANVPFYVLLGALSSLVSVYFLRAFRLADRCVKVVRNPAARLLVAGLALGAIVFLFPSLYGEGYSAMRSMLTGKAPEMFARSVLGFASNGGFAFALLLFLVALAKPVATALSIGAGGVGGTFAPTLFVGCATGLAFAEAINLAGIVSLPAMNFALAGMAGALSGVMAAPLTAVFLIAELTGGYELFIPLIVVSVTSSLIARRFEPFSIYTRPLGLSGALITHHRDKAALSLMEIGALVDRDRPRVFADATMEELAAIVITRPNDSYPAFSRDGRFAGILKTRDIIPVLANDELREVTIVDDLILRPRLSVNLAMDAAACFDTFKASGEDELPVFENEAFAGFLSRARLQDAYKRTMEALYADDEPRR
jgi:CIC family chloride channel protein